MTKEEWSKYVVVLKNVYVKLQVPINQFVPKATFLYPLKTSENRKIFWCFQRVEKGCMGTTGLKKRFDRATKSLKTNERDGGTCVGHFNNFFIKWK